jgi:hypothetical protein
MFLEFTLAGMPARALMLALEILAMMILISVKLGRRGN